MHDGLIIPPLESRSSVSGPHTRVASHCLIMIRSGPVRDLLFLVPSSCSPALFVCSQLDRFTSYLPTSKYRRKITLMMYQRNASGGEVTANASKSVPPHIRTAPPSPCSPPRVLRPLLHRRVVVVAPRPMLLVLRPLPRRRRRPAPGAARAPSPAASSSSPRARRCACSIPCRVVVVAPRRVLRVLRPLPRRRRRPTSGAARVSSTATSSSSVRDRPVVVVRPRPPCRRRPSVIAMSSSSVRDRPVVIVVVVGARPAPDTARAPSPPPPRRRRRPTPGAARASSPAASSSSPRARCCACSVLSSAASSSSPRAGCCACSVPSTYLLVITIQVWGHR
jgi:hypothetical protein